MCEALLAEKRWCEVFDTKGFWFGRSLDTEKSWYREFLCGELVPGAVCSLNSAQAVVEAGLLNELLIVVKLSYGLGCCAAEPSYDPA